MTSAGWPVAAICLYSSVTCFGTNFWRTSTGSRTTGQKYMISSFGGEVRVNYNWGYGFEFLLTSLGRLVKSAFQVSHVLGYTCVTFLPASLHSQIRACLPTCRTAGYGEVKVPKETRDQLPHNSKPNNYLQHVSRTCSNLPAGAITPGESCKSPLLRKDSEQGHWPLPGG